MTYPLVPFNAGQRLTAPSLNNALSVDRVVEAPADQSCGPTTTLINSTYLLMPVAANSIYTFNCCILYDAATAGDIKFDWTVPAGAFLRKAYWTSAAASTAADAPIFHQADDVLTGNSMGIGGTIMCMTPMGAIATAAAAGNLQFRFAQITASGNTTIKAGSWMRLTKVG